MTDKYKHKIALKKEFHKRRRRAIQARNIALQKLFDFTIKLEEQYTHTKDNSTPLIINTEE